MRTLQNYSLLTHPIEILDRLGKRDSKELVSASLLLPPLHCDCREEGNKSPGGCQCQSCQQEVWADIEVKAHTIVINLAVLDIL